MSITEEQLKAIRLGLYEDVPATSDPWIALGQAKAFGKLAMIAVDERDATIAELRQSIRVLTSRSLRIDKLQAELAELRKPVAVERNERVEQIRLEHLAASPVQEMPSWQYTYDTRRDLLSAYDSLAQDCARYANAHDVLTAEMRGLRERLDAAAAVGIGQESRVMQL